MMIFCEKILEMKVVLFIDMLVVIVWLFVLMVDNVMMGMIRVCSWVFLVELVLGIL